MSMPKQKPGQSKQDYGTPWEFVRAVEARWGPIDIDLAADADNAKCARWVSEEEDSLSVDWAALGVAHAWLNPPYDDIPTWAAKCKDACARDNGLEISFLIPSSVSTNYFADIIFGNALVLPIRPRLVFDGVAPNPKTGKTDPFPKDLMLCRFGDAPGFEPWAWRSA